MGKKDPRIDAYIARSADFAKPILGRLRKVVHASCPDVEETLKWGHPTFMHKGILCGMASFKGHCAFGFWKHKLLQDELLAVDGKLDDAMGQFGRITRLADLPDDRSLRRMVEAAVDLNDRDVKPPLRRRPTGPRILKVPQYFREAVSRNKKARATFDQFSYSNKKEYVEWVTEAKGDETRRRRLETAVAWMAEGKARNWMYMRK